MTRGRDAPATLEDPVRRVLSSAGTQDLLDVLVDRLSGADFTTLMLEVVRRRAARLTPSDVLRRYASDRFVAPSPLPFDRLRQTEDALLDALPPGFRVVTLSPVAPMGTHSTLAGVDQNRVLSTLRGSDVAADPTNALALEAAVLRRDLLERDARSAESVHLAASQRVVRGQHFDDPAALAHFHLFALVTAGRDTGSLRFEQEAAAEHLAFVAQVLGRRAVVELSDLTGGRMSAVVDAVRERLGGVEVVEHPDRAAGRDYYAGFAFKGASGTADGTIEIADGGLVDWTQKLLANRKERLFITGIGVERLMSL